jgi:hypothetical protein
MSNATWNASLDHHAPGGEIMPVARRLRGVVGMAATWAVAFSLLATTMLAAALAVGALPREVFGAQLFGAPEFRAVALLGFAAGALAGTLFAALLARAERRHALSALSTRRMALWGFLAAASIPLTLAAALGVAHWFSVGALAVGSLGFGALGAGTGAAMARMTHRALRLPPAAARTPDTTTPVA